MARFIPSAAPVGCDHIDPQAAVDLADRDTLWRKWLRYVYRLAVHRVKYAAPADPAIDANDLTQEIALVTHRFLGNFDPRRGTFRNWLGLMATRATHYIRAAATREKRTRRRVAMPKHVRDRRATRPECNGDVWEMVNRHLNEREKLVVELRVRSGLEWEEIGRRLGTSRAWPIKLWSAAIKKLRAAAAG